MRSAALLAAIVWGCDAPAPRLLEVVTPGKTADTHGPYQVTAVTRGAVDEVRLYWHVGDPEAEPVVHTMDDQGGAWRGEIPGQPHGTEIRLWLEADGPGGTARSPRGEGVHVFSVARHDGACVFDGDCEAGQVCDRFEAQCHAPPEVCVDDGDCGQDYICVDGACRFRPDACENDAACGAGFECLEGRCARVGDPPPPPPPPPGCEGGCPPDSVCEAGECVRVDTEACGGCPAGRRCLRETGDCVECHADGHCPGGHCDMNLRRCEDGPRTTPCTPCAPGTCSTGMGCAEVYAFVCLPRCGANSRCPRETRCRRGLCEPQNFCYGGECRRDADCDSGVCQAGFCEQRQFCEGERDCGGGRTCRDGRCADARPLCQGPFDCGAGQLCVGGRCQPGAPSDGCGPCETSLDCPSAAVCGETDEGSACYSYCRDGCPGGLECVEVGEERRVGICVDPATGMCSGAERACGQDPFEPNDTLDDPTVLQPNRGRVEAALCSRDIDVYRLDRTGAPAFVDVETQGPLVLRSFTGGGQALSAVDVGRGQSTWELRGESAMLMFQTNVDGDVEYAVTFRERREVECDDDNLEPDDSRDDATVLGNGASIRAVGCPADPDWYRLRLRRSDARGTVTMVSGDPGAPLRYHLEGEDGGGLGDGPVGRNTSVDVRNTGRAVYLRVLCDGCADSVGYTIQTRFQ